MPARIIVIVTLVFALTLTTSCRRKQAVMSPDGAESSVVAVTVTVTDPLGERYMADEAIFVRYANRAEGEEKDTLYQVDLWQDKNYYILNAEPGEYSLLAVRSWGWWDVGQLPRRLERNYVQMPATKVKDYRRATAPGRVTYLGSIDLKMGLWPDRDDPEQEKLFRSINDKDYLNLKYPDATYPYRRPDYYWRHVTSEITATSTGADATKKFIPQARKELGPAWATVIDNTEAAL